MSTPSQQRNRRAKSTRAGLAEMHGPTWQVQTAKARFSEVFRLARTEGPQRITRQGKEGVVMISDEQYHRLTAKSRQPKSLVQFFRESPLVGVKLDLERDKDAGRDIEL
jgi:antitoxin Phd